MRKIYLLLVFISLTFSTSYAASSMAITGGGNAGTTICQGAIKVVIYSFTGVSGTTTDAITAWTFSTEAAGTAVSGTDITNFQYWASTSSTFSTGTATLLATVTTGLGAGAHPSGAFSYTPAASATTYFYITATISATAAIGNTIIVEGYAAAATAGSILAYSTSVPFTCATTFTPTGNINPSGTYTIEGVPGAISGANAVCYGGSTITLSDPVTGGTWSSSVPVVASVGLSTGLVTGGIAAGNTTISYSTGCGTAATTTVTAQAPISAPPSLIIGTTAFCQGSNLALSDSTAGGAWSSVSTSVATVNSSGVVRGVAPGTSVISYTIGNSCGSLSTVSTVTVNALPAPAVITGNAIICGMSSLSDATIGGAWSSSNTIIATVDTSGVVTGVSTGTATISYIMNNSCGIVFSVKGVTINSLPAPSAITGPANVCVGGNMTLHDMAPGGVWCSTNTSIAIVGTATGVVTGIATGSATIDYTITNSCGSGVTAAAVNAIVPLSVPSAIIGVANLCIDGTLTLSDATTGGTWICSPGSAGIATISPLGVVSGIAGGTATISYSVANSCGLVSVAAPVTIVPLPVVGTITGSVNVCPGYTITLSDGVSGGVWSSAVSYYASISGAGIVTGINQGLANISYTVTNICGSVSAAFAVDVLAIGSPVCTPASVNMVSGTEADLKIFPNPNTGAFSIDLLSAVANEPVHVIITNLVGEKVKEFITTANKVVDVKLSSVSGIYLLSVSTAESRYVTKIIVQ